MANLNKVMLIGNLTRDPELRVTPKGTAICTFSIAVNRKFKDDSGGAGHAHKRTDPERFFPTKMRITMIQVAKGAKYDPKLVPGLPEKQ